MECQPGTIADGEVETDDAVDRDDQRRRQSRQQQIRHLIALPMPRRAAPAHGQDAVYDLARPMLAPVAQRREIRNQADVPEQKRDGEIRADREHIPHSGLRNCGQRPIVSG